MSSVEKNTKILDIVHPNIYYICMKCLNCAEPISGKATFCSDKCRMAYRRRTKQGEQPEQNDPEHTTRTLDFSPTRTDRLFEDSKPGYYKFTDLRSDKCLQCGKEFKTHLKLLRQCSPACMQKMLDSLTV